MRLNNVEELIQITLECIERFWQLDVEYVISYFHQDILWVGLAKEQYKVGYDAAVEDFRSILKELVPCKIINPTFAVVQNNRGCITIVGSYVTVCDKDSDYNMQANQRATFTWERSDDGNMLIKHIHISNPMGKLALAEGERVPNSIGEMTRDYMRCRLAIADERERIVLRDFNEATHFLAPSEIAYVEADRRYIIVHPIIGEPIHCRVSIGEFADVAPIEFLSVHRSYIVNIHYVTAIQPYEVVMANGDALPVPVKKYVEIRQTITNYLDNP